MKNGIRSRTLSSADLPEGQFIPLDTSTSTSYSFLQNIYHSNNNNNNLNNMSSNNFDDPSLHLSHLSLTPTPNITSSSSPIQNRNNEYQIDVPIPTSNLNGYKFIYLNDNLEEQCDYLFFRIYTLSNPTLYHSYATNQNQNKVDYMNDPKSDYETRKRDILNEWIGKKTFLSMCLSLDMIDDR